MLSLHETEKVFSGRFFRFPVRTDKKFRPRTRSCSPWRFLITSSVPLLRLLH